MAIRHKVTEPRSSLWDNDHVGDVEDLDDVTLTGVASDEVLAWNGSAWVNVAQSGGGGGGGGELVVAETITDPPEIVWTEDGTDFVYEEV